MSSTSSLAERRRKKQLTILAVMVGITGITWSRTLFGGSKAASPSPPPAAAAAAGQPAAIAAPRSAAAAPAAGSISSFDQAMARMQVWPRALDRQIHSGPIEEIVPFEDLLSAAGEGPEADQQASEAPAPTPRELIETATPTPPAPPQPSFEDLNLELTTTAILGKARYAVIEGQRVQVGEEIEIQVGQATVRYVVSAILPRAVELRDGESTHVLRIASPGLKFRGHDGA